MESSTSENPKSVAAKTKFIIYSCSNRILRVFLDHLPSADSSLIAKISNIYRPTSTAGSRRRRSELAHLLHTKAIHSSSAAAEESRIFVVLEDIMEHTLSSLHIIQKNLAFWQAIEVETEFQKIWFMIFNRGPRAFIHESYQIIRRLGSYGSPFQYISCSAANTVSFKIATLTRLQRCLSAFLAQIYLEIYIFETLSTEDPDKSLPSLLMAIDQLFSKLEASISHPVQIYNVKNCSLSTESGNSCALIFEKLPSDHERTQWTETEVRGATNLIHQNLQHLDSYLSFMLSSCQKPSRMTLYWLRYTFGAVGLSACSLWFLRHSSLMGSSDIDNWIQAAKESTSSFWEEHVQQPLVAIRDELFETFRKRHKGVMEMEEVQLTSNSLHRMLLAFSEQTKGQKLPENLTDQEMMEIVMSRYEKEVMHPLQNLISGELARAMLIQIQKLKLDLETAMLELDQILKANEINFAILAALPAFSLSLLLLYLVRTWVHQDKGAEGRGRMARVWRRLRLVEIEEWIMQFQAYSDQGLEEDAQWMYGMMLYGLDQLCKAVEKNAKETREWPRLRQDFIKLMRPDVKVEHKLAVVLRMGRMYECLLPYSKQH